MLSDQHHELFLFLNSLGGNNVFFDSLLYFLSNGAGIALTLSVIAIVLFRMREPRRTFVVLAHIFIPVLVAGIYSEVLKELFLAPRPWLVLESANLMFEHGGMDSFPSGHSTVYAALAVSSFFFSKRLGIFVGIFALCIGLSRVISGVHWPIDILAGLTIGSLVSASYYAHVTRKSTFFQKKQ